MCLLWGVFVGVYVTPVMVKLFLLCPRQLWLSYNTWFRPVTSSMVLGRRVHEGLCWDRVVSRLGASEVRVGFYLESKRYPLRGIVDAVVRVGGGWFPVEYKHQVWVGVPEKIQVTLYALMLEEYVGAPVTRAYIVTPARILDLKVTGALRRRAVNALNHTLKTIQQPIPPPPKPTALCGVCPYKSYCSL